MHTVLSQKKLFSHLGQALCYTGYAGAGIALAVLLVGFVPHVEGPYARRSISKQVLTLGPQDYPRPIEAQGQWSFRAKATTQFPEPTSAPSLSSIPVQCSTAWLQFDAQGVSLNTAAEVSLHEVATSLALVLTYDTHGMPIAPKQGDAMHSALLSVQLKHHGEALNGQGQPLRWGHDAASAVQAAHAAEQSEQVVPFTSMCAAKLPSIDSIQASLQDTLPNAYALPSGFNRSGSVMDRAGRYREIITKVAAQFGIRESLIFAMIQTESNFFPHVISPAKAMGLMQLLPGTASTMHKYVFGHAASMGYKEVTEPEMNITLGVAFLKLLMTHYFEDIADVRSRELCAIASYNMGPARLYPFFGASKEEAIASINAMKPDDVFQRLATELPYRETRMYISQVNSRDAIFKDF